MPNRWIVEYLDPFDTWVRDHPNDDVGPFEILNWVLDRTRHGPVAATEGPEVGEHLESIPQTNIDVVYYAAYLTPDSGIIRVQSFRGDPSA